MAAAFIATGCATTNTSELTDYDISMLLGAADQTNDLLLRCKLAIESGNANEQNIQLCYFAKDTYIKFEKIVEAKVGGGELPDYTNDSRRFKRVYSRIIQNKAVLINSPVLLPG